MTRTNPGIAVAFLSCALSIFGQQATRQVQPQGDNRPRVFVETGPQSEIVGEEGLQLNKSTFTEGFPSLCPGAVITGNRSRASYLVRLGLSVLTDEELTLTYSMAVIRKDGDQIFADSVMTRGGEGRQGIKNPPMRFMREACALIVYGLDAGTVYRITRQAERRQPLVYSTAALEGSTDEKVLRGLATLFGIAFSQACFCVERTDDFGKADYVLQVDMSKRGGSITILDRWGHFALDEQQVRQLDEAKIFSRNVPMLQANSSNRSRVTPNELLGDACEAILRREHP